MPFRNLRPAQLVFLDQGFSLTITTVIFVIIPRHIRTFMQSSSLPTEEQLSECSNVVSCFTLFITRFTLLPRAHDTQTYRLAYSPCCNELMQRAWVMCHSMVLRTARSSTSVDCCNSVQRCFSGKWDKFASVAYAEGFWAKVIVFQIASIILRHMNLICGGLFAVYHFFQWIMHFVCVF